MINPIYEALCRYMPDQRFTPRLHCGEWHTWEAVIYIASNSLIAMSYFGICHSIYYARKKIGLNIFGNAWATKLFLSFIFFCGVGHALDNVVSMWWARYDVFLWWHLLTSLVSLATWAYIPFAIAGFASEIAKIYKEHPDAAQSLRKLAEENEG